MNDNQFMLLVNAAMLILIWKQKLKTYLLKEPQLKENSGILNFESSFWGLKMTKH